MNSKETLWQGRMTAWKESGRRPSEMRYWKMRLEKVSSATPLIPVEITKIQRRLHRSRCAALWHSFRATPLPPGWPSCCVACKGTARRIDLAGDGR